MKTNGARFLETLDIRFELQEYEVDADDLSAIAAELDFKKLARAAGLRKAEMAPLKDVQPLTGYIRGGVTVFGAKKSYPVFVDETAILFERISVSAGARGAQLVLAPGDYLRAAQAQTADLTKSAGTKSAAGEGRA